MKKVVNSDTIAKINKRNKIQPKDIKDEAFFFC